MMMKLGGGWLGDGVRFAAVGVTAALTHAIVALAALTAGLPPLAANLAGFLIALGVSLAGHHHFSFQRRTPFLHGAVRFLPAALIGFAANSAALWSVLALTGPRYAWLKLLVSLLVIPPATFLYARAVAYRERRD